MADVQAAASKAKVLNGERARFDVAGGEFRLIVAINFTRQIVFVKFIGSHAEYHRINALTVSRYQIRISIMAIEPIRTGADHAAALARI